MTVYHCFAVDLICAFVQKRKKTDCWLHSHLIAASSKETLLPVCVSRWTFSWETRRKPTKPCHWRWVKMVITQLAWSRQTCEVFFEPKQVLVNIRDFQFYFCWCAHFEISNKHLGREFQQQSVKRPRAIDLFLEICGKFLFPWKGRCRICCKTAKMEYI